MAKKNNNQNEETKVFCNYGRHYVRYEMPYDVPIYEPNLGIAICRQCIKDIYHVIEQNAADCGEPDAEVDNVKNSQNTETQKFDIDAILENNKPSSIKEYLDDYIIEQDRAKKILAVAVYNHYKRIKYAEEHNDDDIEKSNIIMLGPSGCGKTALLYHLSKLLDVPFAVTDASSLTEAGYVGADAEVAVRNLYYAANKDIARAERGIIYLDEFDKIARKSGINNSITADPGHEGVQQSLLKMIEGNVVEFTAKGQRKHPEAPTIKLNTKNVLFIVGGAFVDIEKIISKRINKDKISLGFNSVVKSESEKNNYNEIIHKAQPEDLMEFGILPEAVGRLPIICTLEELDEDALLRILTEPKNAIIKQYTKLLSIDDVKLTFNEKALRAIAKKAIAQKTGARSLKGIIEDIMLDIMYDIPNDKRPREIIVTEQCVTEGKKPEIRDL
ncbi:MAG: ATP-dependent Clp protease ATP-binding subunit ClpX [Selenomonadaceae bacterium]|nr:ATP-dependent Clp protease ATP-binding subunit ClpX [Selenomonadaceae bacterium]MBP3722430.1 ATP-dependent Clp protease ATP-binding subunit ClpX [Selenomonadaceae bacterium]